MGEVALPVVRVVRPATSIASVFSGWGVPEPVVAAWCREGAAFVLGDLAAPPGEDVLAAALCGPRGETVELRLLLLPEESTAERVGRCLVEGTVNTLRAWGVKRVAVWVRAPDVSDQSRLESLGFQRAPDGAVSALREAPAVPLRLVLEL